MLTYAFGDDAQAVIATHVDKGHIHSHIVLNSYSLSGQKFYANKASLRRLREISDGVSKAFGIEIHPNLKSEGRSMQYNEWQHKKNGTSWKQQIRDEIDKLIGEVNSLDELLQLLEERGYEVKRGKYISIKAPGQERFVRTKTLGKEYTEESLKIRITYRDMGPGMTPTQDEQNNLSQAYVAVLHDVRILATQHKKVPRKQIITAEYSVDNDLDIYRLSAQMSVMNKYNIHSLGELEGWINEQKKQYEKYRVEVNSYIEEYNKLAGVLEQAEQYYELAKKSELSESEQLKMKICWQTMLANHIMTAADVDDLRSSAAGLNKKIGGLREKMSECRQRYDVFTDIQKTYSEISQEDYVAKLVEEERQRQEQMKKKKRSR
ncbi:MAG: relaxase/mobilization nuclease domain-containing protein [Ruminococcus sp.]|nr:relaxase/mobilization nuclease domain-containing protein [Ruminococcus sp.]